MKKIIINIDGKKRGLTIWKRKCVLHTSDIYGLVFTKYNILNRKYLCGTLIKSTLQFSVTNNKFWKINKEYTKINVYTICSHYSFGALEQVNWLFKKHFCKKKTF